MKKEDIIICENDDELFYKYCPKRLDYIITREKFDNERDVKEQRREVIDRLNKIAREKIDNNSYCYFNDTHVIIIWEGFEKERYLTDCIGYSEEHLLRTISHYLRRHWVAGRIFITSPLALTKLSNPSYMEVLRNLHIIWKESTIVPEFLKDNFLTALQYEGEFDEELEKYIERTKNNVKVINLMGQKELPERSKRHVERSKEELKQINEIAFLRHKYKEHYERFFRTIDALIEMVSEKIKVKEETNFIDLYFLWQHHEISVEEAIDKLPGCSRANWYRYVTAFENSPIYENYTIMYFSGRYIEPKRGHTPNPFKLISYYKTIKDLEHLQTIPLHPIERLLYDNFQEIHAINDSYKCVQAAMKTISIYKHKGILREKAAEYGLTEEDLYIEKYELWEPHKYDD